MEKRKKYFLFNLMGLIGLGPRNSKTTNDQSTQPYFVGTTLHTSNHSIHLQVYSDLKFIDKRKSYYNIPISVLLDPTLQNKLYNTIVTTVQLVTFKSQYLWDITVQSKYYSNMLISQ
jgi:hypothetical protein